LLAGFGRCLCRWREGLAGVVGDVGGFRLLVIVVGVVGGLRLLARGVGGVGGLGFFGLLSLDVLMPTLPYLFNGDFNTC